MVLLSFIVPVYNGERDIVQCLNSLCNQGLAESDYEVICIDDHSSDNSVRVILDFSDTHKCVRLIQHEENKKTGTSCNEGLDNANGQYVWIIGQDDWIEPFCVNNLLHKCICDKLDLLLFNYNRMTDAGVCCSSPKVFCDSEILSGRVFISKYFRNDFSTYLLGYEWRSIISTTYLRDQNIRCTEGSIYEDTTILFKSIYFSNRIASIQDNIYNYRMNNHSITDSQMRFRGDLAYDFSFVAGKEVFELSNSIEDKWIASSLFQKALWFFSRFIFKIVPAPNEEKHRFYSLVKQNKSEIFMLLSNSKWYVRLLALPCIGHAITCMLKPLYDLKHIIWTRRFESGI